MWKLDREEYYFRILDSKRRVAGYFDPDYGVEIPQEREQEMVDAMWSERIDIPGGHVTVGMAKFGIFEGEYLADIDSLNAQLRQVDERIGRWKEFVAGYEGGRHTVSVSHTDQDMLAITIPVRFPKPIKLDASSIRPQLESLLAELSQRQLL